MARPLFDLLLENAESMQILHCEPHFDYFHDQTNQELGGHRVATVLMYLSNVQKDGETILPNSEVRMPLMVTVQKSSYIHILQSDAKNGYSGNYRFNSS